MTKQFQADNTLVNQATDRQHPRFVPIAQWGVYFDWPPPGGLRHLRFNCQTNGFKAAFKKVGSRVLVDSQVFWKIVEEEGER
jgi:hypothetical protein